MRSCIVVWEVRTQRDIREIEHLRELTRGLRPRITVFQAFFEEHKEHTCGTYRPMMLEGYEEEYKLYRKKTRQFSMPPKIS